MDFAEALGIEFPAFLAKNIGRPLSLKNVEHVLCKFDKYYRWELMEIIAAKITCNLPGVPWPFL